MKKFITVAILFSFVLLATTSSLLAQTPATSPKPGAAPHPAASPQVLLRQYVAALAKSPDNDALRGKIIKLAVKMKPAPTLPVDATQHMAAGTVLLQDGNGKAAVAEFAQAVAAAPWLPDAYWKLSLAQDKAGMPAAELKSLNFFLLTMPSAAEAEAANSRIREIESRPQQLQQWVDELAKNPSDNALREKIIQLARQIEPAPAVPSEAQDFARTAEAEANQAKTAADLVKASGDYRKALLLAPWVAEFYFNLGVIQEKSGQLAEAKSNFGFYLLAAPEAQDAAAVRKRMANIDAQQTLQEYTTQLAANPGDTALREKIINLVVAMDSPPPLPEDALRYLGRGNAALQDAKSAQDFQDAIAEFDKAVLAAPWFADAYYNLANAQAAAGNYGAAAKSVNLFLLAAPNSPDAPKAKKLMYELEYKQEKAEKERAQRAAEEAAAQQRAAERQAILAGLSGYWACQQGCGSATVSVYGASFNASVDTGPAQGGTALDDRGRAVGSVVVTLAGTLNDFKLDGTMSSPRMYQSSTNCTIAGDSNAFTGTISEDGKTMTLHSETAIYTTHAQKGGSLLFPTVTCDDIRLDHKIPVMMVLQHVAAPVQQTSNNSSRYGSRKRSK
jgi:tetratricopeptide (TPR) repeat protein